MFNLHIHGECFIYKDTKISNRLREQYVVARCGHRSKTEGDLTYLRLGTNGNELSFIKSTSASYESNPRSSQTSYFEYDILVAIVHEAWCCGIRARASWPSVKAVTG